MLISAGLCFICLTSVRPKPSISFFFFNDTATTEIYTLSLHDALPIFQQPERGLLAQLPGGLGGNGARVQRIEIAPDRKSTRLNSSHLVISYAVFCLKKKKKIICTNCRPTNLFTARDVYMSSVTTHFDP